MGSDSNCLSTPHALQAAAKRTVVLFLWQAELQPCWMNEKDELII